MRRKGETQNSNGESSRENRRGSSGWKRSLKEEREKLVLWKSPMRTVDYFARELFLNSVSFLKSVSTYRKSLAAASVLSLVFVVLLKVEGPHEAAMASAGRTASWCLYWLGLGVLSSIGLGTGLHTFLLYLGPHIAGVTLAAYECGSLNFPEPPYPAEILCPRSADPSWAAGVWNIMWKVHLEAIMWGAGTALGELPPYFMARAARLSGHDPDDEDELREFEELQRKKRNPEALDALDRAKLTVERLVDRVGFFGILVCASIPNPLFDLAGITCGHFLVPFWTFFGATLIGKAVIKMSLQGVFVIVAFSDVLIDKVMYAVGAIPSVGVTLQGFLQGALQMQRDRLHSRSNVESGGNPLSTIFEIFVLAMVAYFVVSIVNSLAQSYHKRLHKAGPVGKKSWTD